MTRRQVGPVSRVWLGFVVAGTLLGAVIAGAVSVLAPSGYTARVTVLVTPAPTGSTITSSDLQIAQAYIPTLAELATIRPVLTSVVSTTGIQIDPDELANAISTRVPAGTSLLTIAVSNPNAEQASALANGIAARLREFLPAEGSPASGNLKLVLTIVDPATAPTVRDGPGLPLRVALGGAIALFLAISLAFVVENAGRGAQNLGRGIEQLGRRPTLEPAPLPRTERPETPQSALFRTATQRPVAPAEVRAAVPPATASAASARAWADRGEAAAAADRGEADAADRIERAIGGGWSSRPESRAAQPPLADERPLASTSAQPVPAPVPIPQPAPGGEPSSTLRAVVVHRPAQAIAADAVAESGDHPDSGTNESRPANATPNGSNTPSTPGTPSTPSTPSTPTKRPASARGTGIEAESTQTPNRRAVEPAAPGGPNGARRKARRASGAS